MRFHSYAVLGLAATLAAGTASAQDRADRFVERDQNRDGVLSQAEYTSTGGHPGNFRALDVNGDGVLSRGEFVARNGAVEAPAYEDQVYDDQVYDDRVYDDDRRYEEPRSTGKSVAIIGGSAAAGAVIGGIAGGGKGAAIGALGGGAAGLIYDRMTRNK